MCRRREHPKRINPQPWRSCRLRAATPAALGDHGKCKCLKIIVHHCSRSTRPFAPSKVDFLVHLRRRRLSGFAGRDRRRFSWTLLRCTVLQPRTPCVPPRRPCSGFFNPADSRRCMKSSARCVTHSASASWRYSERTLLVCGLGCRWIAMLSTGTPTQACDARPLRSHGCDRRHAVISQTRNTTTSNEHRAPQTRAHSMKQKTETR